MLIGSRIKELRKEKGLSQEKLGKLINVTKVSISCYENETRSPDLETFELLVDALDTTPDYLLGRDKLIVSDNSDSYKKYISTIDLEILNEITKNTGLIKFLRKNPRRGVEYIVKKID